MLEYFFQFSDQLNGGHQLLLAVVLLAPIL